MPRRLAVTLPRILTLALGLLLLASCQKPRSETCPSGLICPPDTKCAANQNICISGNCGDGIVQSGEVCDDGNVVDGDGCSADCKSNETCGNGIRDIAAGEVCDDGNNVSGDRCSADCQSSEGCGNGIRDPGEDCDTGDGGFDTFNCNSNCTFPRCGDRYTNVDAGEQCDTGGESTTCNLNCTIARCGDRIINATAGEDCDADGGDTVACDSDCTIPRCGDGHANPARGEECDDGDDGGNDNTHDCLVSCKLNVCGDGFVKDAGTAPLEECDDGNKIDEVACPYGTPSCTGCSSTCHRLTLTGPYCGDGFVDGGMEVCDDGNNVTETSCPYGAPGGRCVRCDSACRTVLNLTGLYCGDGFVDGGMEVCDDGNAVTETECPYGQIPCTRCDSRCQTQFVLDAGPYCGDGMINGPSGREACDDGNALACGTCNIDCTRSQQGPATGSITAVRNLNDRETFTLNDGVNPPVIFEFDNNGSVGQGHIAVSYGGNLFARDVALNIESAIRSAHSAGTLRITANADPDPLIPVVHLINDRPGSVGNQAITETVGNVNFSVTGMSGGGGYDCTAGAGCSVDEDCETGLTCQGTGPKTCATPPDAGSPDAGSPDGGG